MEKTIAKKHLAWEKEKGKNFAKLSANVIDVLVYKIRASSFSNYNYINEAKILLFTDGGSGANEDVAMVIYNEGGFAEGDYSGELTLANILESTTISTLTHDNFWG